MTPTFPEPDFRFETLGNPSLENALAECRRFVDAISRRHPPHWLTLCGPSGVGKTHLARKLWFWIKATQPLRRVDFSYAPTLWHWPSFVSDIRSGDRRGELREAADWPFLALDDIGAERITDNSAEALTTLLGKREGRWTILTSNLTAAAVTRALDARITSRMLRNGGRIVEINAPDYGLRPPPAS